MIGREGTTFQGFLLRVFVSSWPILVLGCAEHYYLDLPDVNLGEPVDLDVRIRRFRSGEERWHGDPKAVADAAIREHLDVPWKADPFNARYYDLKESAEWGTHVVRGYRYPNGGEMRYRVKVRRHEDIWYPVQVSRYKVVELPDDRHGHSHNH